MAKIKYNQIEDINLLDEKITIATNDVFLIEDSEDLFNVKRFKATNLPSGGSSTFAFTDPTVNSEGTDYLPLYDNSDSNNPKKSTITNIITDNNIVITSDLTGFLSLGDNISLLTNDSGYITGYTVTEGDITAHQAALTITESQISDLNHFTPTNLLTDYGITLSTVAISNNYNDLDNLPIITTPTEKDILGVRVSASVTTTYNIDLNEASDFHYTMTADTAFTFTNTPTGTQVRRCKLRLTGEFAPSWTQAGLQVFGDGYDGTKWNDVLVEMWLDGTIKGLLIFQQRETA